MLLAHVSEEHIASIFRVKILAEQETTEKAGGRTFRRNTSPPSSGSKKLAEQETTEKAGGRTFRRNISPPSSGSKKYNPKKKPA
jgi:hypothetical protein